MRQTGLQSPEPVYCPPSVDTPFVWLCCNSFSNFCTSFFLRDVRRRGFVTWSIPKFINAKLVPSKAIPRPGGTNHHHAPLIMAPFWDDQYNIVPQLVEATFSKPR